MTPQEVLSGIRDAHHHRGGIRCLRLFRLPNELFTALRDDVDALCRSHAPSDVTLPGHVTHWTNPYGGVLQYSLLNRTGRYDDFAADHDLSCFGKRFHDAAAYPTLGRFIDEFPHCVNFRVNVLGPEAGLSPHEEPVLFHARGGGVGVRARFHLPLVTNPAAELALDGVVYHLEEAEIYFVNNGCIHSAANRGDRPRVHLVWDMLLTPEAFNLMFGPAADLTLPLQRVPEPQREPSPIRTVTVLSHERVAGTVCRAGADEVTLCDPQ